MKYSSFSKNQVLGIIMITAKISLPIFGEKLYQERARAALPLLVRQAKARAPIYYSDLAEELSMPNPRNLNYVLGSIGRTLELLSNEWNEKIPPIQCLVVNRSTGLPGEGIGWFLVKKEDFKKLGIKEQREIVRDELQHIFSFQKWAAVLEALSLEPSQSNFSMFVNRALGSFGGGESEAHKKLKEYVAKNPKAIGLNENISAGQVEFPLPSGDYLDVSFAENGTWIAAEVKPSISCEKDIIRGLFQCVKYKAVIEAVQLSTSKPQNARSILVLESKFPNALIPLRNILGVEVIENVSPSVTDKLIGVT